MAGNLCEEQRKYIKKNIGKMKIPKGYRQHKEKYLKNPHHHFWSFVTSETNLMQVDETIEFIAEAFTILMQIIICIEVHVKIFWLV